MAKSNKENSEELSVDTSHVGESLKATGQVEEFMEKNFKVILIGLGVGTLLAIGYVFYLHNSEQHSAKGMEAFTSAQSNDELEKAAEAFKGTLPAGTSLFLLGAREVESGKYSEAKATLNRFLNQSKDHPLRHRANFLLGVIAEKEGKTEDAMKQFEAVSKEKRSLGALAMIRHANLQSTQGLEGLKSAEKTLSDVLIRFPGTPYQTLASERAVVTKRKIRIANSSPPTFQWPAEPEKTADKISPLDLPKDFDLDSIRIDEDPSMSSENFSTPGADTGTTAAESSEQAEETESTEEVTPAPPSEEIAEEPSTPQDGNENEE